LRPHSGRFRGLRRSWLAVVIASDRIALNPGAEPPFAPGIAFVSRRP
jgi:hypothetical protein